MLRHLLLKVRGGGSTQILHNIQALLVERERVNEEREAVNQRTETLFSDGFTVGMF